jgi:hypothetical protein
MKVNTRALLDRLIREGIEHTFLNTDVELTPMGEQILANDIEHRIWLYLDEYFTFDEDN